MEAHCEFCCQHLETVTHVLWECPFARNVWGLCKGRIQKCSNTASDFFLLFKHMLTILSPTEMDRWAIIAWTIWNARNRFYFKHIQLHPQTIMDEARAGWDEYKKIMTTECKV